MPKSDTKILQRHEMLQLLLLLLFIGVARNTCCNDLLNLLIYSRPIHNVPCSVNRSLDTEMSCMKFFQNTLSSCLRYEHSIVSFYNFLLHCEFIPKIKKSTNVIRNFQFVVWPLLLNESSQGSILFVALGVSNDVLRCVVFNRNSSHIIYCRKFIFSIG